MPKHPTDYDKTHNRAGDEYPAHAPVPHSTEPDWAYDLSPYPAPEDYEPAVKATDLGAWDYEHGRWAEPRESRVTLTDVPWSAHDDTE